MLGNSRMDSAALRVSSFPLGQRTPFKALFWAPNVKCGGEQLAIRWDEFPHNEIRLKIYARLGDNDVSRSAEDTERNILRRRLPSLNSEDHDRYIRLEARTLVAHLRCTRDLYQEFVNSKGCRPVLDAHWVVLRCAVFPTAIAVLRASVSAYARLSRIPLAALSFLFGIVTRFCYEDTGGAISLLCCPDLKDTTPATDDELESLGRLVDEDSLLWFRDIRDDGAVGRPLGGGPFSTDDARTILKSFSVCGLTSGMTFSEWQPLHQKLWNLHEPWTTGLCTLFCSVRDELISQWQALPADSLITERGFKEQVSRFQPVVVPLGSRSAASNRSKPGRKPRLPDCFVVCAGTLWRKAMGNSKAKVSDEKLLQIAVELDARGHVPPAKYLEQKYAQELKTSNSRNSNSKIGPIKSWTQLVYLADKDHLRGMRRLLSRCSKNL